MLLISNNGGDMSNSESLTRLREQIASRYQKHCGSCTGSCCTAELEEGLIAFDWECDEMNKSGRGINHFSFEKGRCLFSGNNACRLSINKRPLDCLTYPVYPQIAFGDKDETSLTGLFVRTGCHRLNEIKEDEALLEMIRTFWERQIKQIDNSDLKKWLGEIRS